MLPKSVLMGSVSKVSNQTGNATSFTHLRVLAMDGRPLLCCIGHCSCCFASTPPLDCSFSAEWRPCSALSNGRFHSRLPPAPTQPKRSRERSRRCYLSQLVQSGVWPVPASERSHVVKQSSAVTSKLTTIQASYILITKHRRSRQRLGQLYGHYEQHLPLQALTLHARTMSGLR